MSEQGRGSAGTIGVVVVLCLMVQLGCSNAATYRVGASGDWSLEPGAWSLELFFKWPLKM
ncbi:unnamed protein product [Prunus armeniaca]